MKVISSYARIDDGMVFVDADPKPRSNTYGALRSDLPEGHPLYFTLFADRERVEPIKAYPFSRCNMVDVNPRWMTKDELSRVMPLEVFVYWLKEGWWPS